MLVTNWTLISGCKYWNLLFNFRILHVNISKFIKTLVFVGFILLTDGM